MNEYIKKAPFMFSSVFIFGMVMGFIICYAMLCYRNGTDTTSTISAIKEQQSLVNAEIGNASNGIRNATNTVKRANDRVSRVQEQLARSERIANDNANRVNYITKIARECKAIAEENGAILNQIRTTDKEY